MWIEVLRARRRNPFSKLNRERIALAIVKDFIRYDLAPVPRAGKQTQPLGAITITMPTETETEEERG